MKFDFYGQAVAFVRENNCAIHTPIHLIQKAMEQGANEAIKQTTERLAKAKEEMIALRARNIGS